MQAGGRSVMSAEVINSSYAVPMTNGANQTNPRADSRDVSLHPMTKRPPKSGRLVLLAGGLVNIDSTNSRQGCSWGPGSRWCLGRTGLNIFGWV